MKILEFKDKKVKFKSKKENEVLVDVFLKKSVEDLGKLWIDYDFDDIRNKKDWREYIECKLKVVMGVDLEKNNEIKIEYFYKNNIWIKFQKEKELFKWKLDYVNLKDYFYPFKVKNNQQKYNFGINYIKKESSLEKLNFNYFYNWFYFSFWNNPDEPTEWIENLYVLKYRFPFVEKIDLNKGKIKVFDVIQIKFSYKQNITSWTKKYAIFRDIANFLLTKVDITQDIQEIKID